MVKLIEILEELEKSTPPSFMGKDTPKLHFVNLDTIDRIDVTTCLTTVELSKEVLSRGIAEKTDLFVTHHELFSPDSNQMIHGVRRQMIRAIIRHGIVVYTLGESFIGTKNGLSEALVAELGLTEYILTTFRLKDEFVGRIAQLPSIPLEDLVETARTVLKPPWMHQVKGGNQILTKVLILPGTLGVDILKKALLEGIDGVVTGEFMYDVARLAFEENVSVLGVGHICSESPGMRNLAMNLAIKFKNTKIEFMPSQGLITSG